MRTPDQLVEQFRRGAFLDTLSIPGFVHFKHVQSIGHIETSEGHMAYVFTVDVHGLQIPPFATATDAQAFVERCAAVCPRREILQ